MTAATDKRLAIQSVVIVGGGTAGWMTAAALSKVLGETLNITLIESEEIGIVGVGEATIPAISIYNNLLQIDEDDFLRQTKGTIKLGIEFVDWLQKGQAYMHAFGYPGRDLGPVSFHHYWLKHQPDKATGSLWDYSVNNEAAKNDKFARPERMPKSPLSDLPYAFHFDASLYAAYLRRFSEKLGVKRLEGRIESVALRPEDGHIESLTLQDKSLIKADLFIDCSGFHGLLIDKALRVGFEDFSHWLPSDRAMAVPCEGTPSITPYTRATAHDAGWQWRIPLQHRIGNGVVYSSGWMSDDQAIDRLMGHLDGKALADPRPIKFKTGRHKAFFNKNCLAIGLSSGFLEPLESTSIHLIQSSIGRLITLFPDMSFNPVLMREFNQQALEEFDLIRDFIILHYYANQRLGDPFWDACRHMSIPDTLAHKIELFKQNGTFINREMDLFKVSSWVQVLIGQGIMPASQHPFVETVPEADRIDYLKNLRFIVKDTVNQMPSYLSFLASV